MGLCLVERERGIGTHLAGCHFAGAAGTCGAGEFGGCLVLHRRSGHSLVLGASRKHGRGCSIVLMLCLFLGAWKIMDYGHAPDAAQATIKEHATWQWWTLAVWFIDWPGIPDRGLPLDLTALKDPFSAMVLASVLGLLTFSLLLQPQRCQRALRHIFLARHLQHLCVLPDDLWMLARRRAFPNDRGVAQAGENGHDPPDCRRRFDRLLSPLRLITTRGQHILGSSSFLPSYLLSLLAGISALMKRSRHFSAVGSAVLMGALMVGFLAWTTEWLRYGMGCG